MMNKNSKLEWRVPAYMAIWTLVAALVKWALTFNKGVTIESLVGYSLIGVLCITAAAVISFTEKHGNTPFLWFKTAPTKHWAMPGLGVFSNASSIAGLGIGFMAGNYIQMISLYVIVSTMLILQRRIVELSMNTKVKRIVLGLVIPTIAALSISGGFFYNNI